MVVDRAPDGVIPVVADSDKPDLKETVEVPVDKTNSDDLKQVKREVARMTAALKAQQDENKGLKEFKEKIEREKMSAEERVQADLKAAKTEREALAREVAQKDAELSQAKLVNKLVSVYDLDDSDFGGIVLAQFKEDEESFEDFAKRMKSDKKFSRFFKQVGGAVKIPDAPGGPDSGSGRGSRGSDSSEADKAWAREQYPNNPEMQKRVLANLNKNKKTRAGEDS